METYQMRLSNYLDSRWADWFDIFQMSYCDNETILTGIVINQTALHGMLVKIRDLGLTILLDEML